MSTVLRESSGKSYRVPRVAFSPAEKIDSLGERFLNHLVPTVLTSGCATPLGEIFDLLSEKYTLTLQSGKLGWRDGKKVLGFFDSKQNMIAIDESLANDDAQSRFVLAHEIGHFYLHRNFLKSLGVDNSDTRDCADQFSLGMSELTKERRRMEYQANRFAMAILMPSVSARRKVIEAQLAAGITRNVGTIWLDFQKANIRDYSMLVGSLSAAFRVPRSIVDTRFRQIGILEETMPDTCSFYVKDALADLFSKASSK